MHVSILALPEWTAAPIAGMYEVLAGLEILLTEEPPGTASGFRADIVGPAGGLVRSATGLLIEVHRSLQQTPATDLVAIPSMLPPGAAWSRGRHPEVAAWIRRVHARGAAICSAGAGTLLLAETGLLDGLDATVPRVYASIFRRHFPGVRLRVDEVLLTAGTRGELATAGGPGSWQDLALYLISTCASPTAARRIRDVLPATWSPPAPFVSFAAPTDHGDPVIRDLQEWIREHYAEASPVEEMSRRSRLPESSLKRRFKRATGYGPLEYVQHVRMDEARRRLEQSDDAVEDICCSVGYREPPFFRRLFRRLTRLTPRDYRRRFRQSPASGNLRVSRQASRSRDTAPSPARDRSGRRR